MQKTARVNAHVQALPSPNERHLTANKMCIGRKRRQRASDTGSGATPVNVAAAQSSFKITYKGKSRPCATDTEGDHNTAESLSSLVSSLSHLASSISLSASSAAAACRSGGGTLRCQCNRLHGKHFKDFTVYGNKSYSPSYARRHQRASVQEWSIPHANRVCLPNTLPMHTSVGTPGGGY